MKRPNDIMSFIAVIVTTVLCAVPLCKALENTRDSTLILISTDPPGPLYPAATWIRFACRAQNHSSTETLHYEWRGFCNTSKTAEVVVMNPIIDEDGWAEIWFLSTYYTTETCVDYVQCYVVDEEGMEYTAVKSILVEGVGVYIDQLFLGSVRNNTAVVVEVPTTLVCQSALRTSCSQGIWIDPNGMQVGHDRTSMDVLQSCSESNRTMYKHAILNLHTPTINSNNSGLYTCIIQDEQRIERRVYIGVYSTLQNEAEEFSSTIRLTHSVEENKIHLNCTTTQLPATSAVWSKNGRRISLGTTYAAQTTLTDVMHSRYVSQLTFEWTGISLSMIHCDVYTEWVSTSDSQYRGVRGSGDFVFLTLNEPAIIDCTTPEDVDQVQWLDDDDNIPHFPGLTIVNKRLTIVNVTEIFHNQTFQCKELNNNGDTRFAQLYRLIVSIPSEAISVTIMGDQSQPAIEGKSFNITCCYTVHATGLLSSPSLEWSNRSGRITNDVTTEYSIITDRQCSTLNILKVTRIHEDETYTCKGVLHSSTLLNGNSLSSIAHTTLNITTTDNTTAITAPSHSDVNCPGVIFLYLSLFVAAINHYGQ